MEEQTLRPQAHVAIDHPHVAVRMRRPHVAVTAGVATSLTQLRDEADAIAFATHNVIGSQRKLPRISANTDYFAAYMEFEDQKSNELADGLKAALAGSGYELTDEEFPV